VALEKVLITGGATASSKGKAGQIWQNAQLNMQYGLFRVHGRIVQVRIYNLANVTFVQGDNGGIVLDAGSDFESTKAAC
jgi:alkyl sulfatase BDS1-like metallo-beta-lactamase superfamily hydrolase